jgi:integrase
MPVRKRGRFYDYEFMVAGQRYSGTFNGRDGKQIAKDKPEARELLYKERRKVIDGTYVLDNEREELKDFSTFVDRVFLPFAREHHASPAHDEFRCLMLKEQFSGKQFNEITMLSVVDFINKRLNSITIRKEKAADGEFVQKKRSPTTVNKEITLLSSIFRMACVEKVATNNPCEELTKSVRKKIPARRKRNRRLLPDEEKILFDTGLQNERAHLQPVTETGLYTGMRKRELFRLQPEHINFTSQPKSFVIKGETWLVPAGWLIIVRTKKGVPRIIPMSQRVRLILQLICEDVTCGRYVFSSSRTREQITDIKTAWTTALEKADIQNLTFHDLRHEWSSRAADAGVPEHVRRDILGHSSTSMTGDYTHASPQAMEQAMELIAAYSKGNILNYDRITTNAS